MISEASRRAIKESYFALKELGYDYQCRKVLYRSEAVYCPCCCSVFEGSTNENQCKDFGEK